MNRKLDPSIWKKIKAIVQSPNSYYIGEEYGRVESGAIIRMDEKPMSRRDRIRAGLQPKNRFATATTTKEICHA